MIKWVKEYNLRVSLFIDKNMAVYLDFTGIEYIPQEVIMCAFYCTAFIEYILAGKTLLDYTNLFSPNHCKKNDKINIVF